MRECSPPFPPCEPFRLYNVRYTMTGMVKKRPNTERLTLTAFRLTPEILAGLRLVRERDGIAISEQARRAIAEWLTTQKALPATRARRGK